MPERLILSQNYPNPFNPSTTITYELAAASTVRLSIYNLLGQEIRRLIDKAQPAGLHRVGWDGLDQAGRAAASGVYLYRLSTHSGKTQSIVTKKMALVR